MTRSSFQRTALLLFAMCCACDSAPLRLDAGRDAIVVVDAPPVDSPPRDSPPGDTTCASARVETTRITPNVIIVIDRSGSMNIPFDGGRSRWDVLDDSLYGMPDGLVFDLAGAVRFGVVMYSDDPELGSCPDVSREPARIANYSALAAQYDANLPGGNTPTGQAIEGVLALIDTLAPVRTDPTVIVLATDGEPATCENSSDIVAGRARSLSAVAAALDQGIRTYVVSVGTEIAMPHLQDVANAGVVRAPSDPDAPFWVATSATGLHDALTAIVTGVVSCEVELVGRIDPELACEGSVALGADTLECETEWRAVDQTHIELLGDACERLRRSTEDLVGTFPCHVLVF